MLPASKIVGLASTLFREIFALHYIGARTSLDF